MVVRFRAALAWAGTTLGAAYPHLLGLTGVLAIVIGVWGWLGWQAGIIIAGLPFASFWIVGQAIEVAHTLPTRD